MILKSPVIGIPFNLIDENKKMILKNIYMFLGLFQLLLDLLLPDLLGDAQLVLDEVDHLGFAALDRRLDRFLFLERPRVLHRFET